MRWNPATSCNPIWPLEPKRPRTGRSDVCVSCPQTKDEGSNLQL
jgi:hypothetical protein